MLKEVTRGIFLTRLAAGHQSRSPSCHIQGVLTLGVCPDWAAALRADRVLPSAPELRFHFQLRALAEVNPRYGYLRLHTVLLREALTANHKQVHH